jgi:multimeric flavodoxin WrbA
MKVIGISGSPRDGNTDWMIKKVLESAKNSGAETELILLRKLDIKFCNGCDICYGTGKKCVIKDDMQEIYDKLLNADVIVVGTPNHFKNVSSLTKIFIDRTNAIVKPERLKGKKAIGLCVGAQDLSDTQHCANALKRFFIGHELKIVDIIKARADKPKEIIKDKKIERKLLEVGRKTIKG